jgi:hypothetical protein
VALAEKISEESVTLSLLQSSIQRHCGMCFVCVCIVCGCARQFSVMMTGNLKPLPPVPRAPYRGIHAARIDAVIAAGVSAVQGAITT